VVGLTLESGAPRQSLAAFVLFVTNVAAILASGIVVMAFHRVHQTFGAAGAPGLPLLRPDLNTAGLNGLEVRVSLVPATYQPVPG
jgi:hypothetical protein